MPPSRWQVVERGRQLIVIDRTTGQEATRRQPEPAPPGGGPSQSTDRPEGLVDQLGGATLDALAGGPDDARGSQTFTTAPWWDDRAPRTISMGPAGARLAGGAVLALAAAVIAVIGIAVWEPFLLLPITLLLVNARARVAWRRHATRFLDRLESAGPY